MTRAEVERLGEGERRRGRGRFLLILFLASLLVVAGGRVLATGDPRGWTMVLFFGAIALLAPAYLSDFFRRCRYCGGAFEARRVAIESATTTMALAVMTTACALAYVGPEDPVGGWALLAAGAVLGAYTGLYAVQAIEPGPVVVLDARGLFDRRAMRAPVAWSEVVEVDVHGPRGDATLHLITAETPGNRRAFAGLAGHRFNRVALSTTGLDCTVTDLFLAINAWKPALLDKFPADRWK